MKRVIYCFIVIAFIVFADHLCNADSLANTFDDSSESKSDVPYIPNNAEVTEGVTSELPDADSNRNAGDGTEETVKQSNVEMQSLQPTVNNTELLLQNETQATKNGTETKVRCALKVLADDEEATVHVVNSSALMKALIPVPNVTSGECAVVMFYSPYCPFSAKAAPHFNAIPRFFPHVSFYAIDAITYTSLNMRYGLVAVPTVLLFHNGKASVKYNDSEPVLDKMVSFLTKYTGISPQGTVSVSPEDSMGPISSVPLAKRDYVLVLSWLFTISFCLVWFAKSALCHRMVECIRNTWQEAEAQHEHED